MENLSQLEAQGNYRRPRPKTWGRSIREIRRIDKFSSRSTTRNVEENKNDDSLPIDRPEFAEISRGDGTSINKEVHGGKPADWAMSLSADREHLDVLKKIERFYEKLSWKTPYRAAKTKMVC